MSKKKTGSSTTSEENRKLARKTQIPGGRPGERFKNITQAREGGMYLPTKEQKAKNKAQEQKVRVETPKRTDVQTKANRIIEDEKKKRQS